MVLRRKIGIAILLVIVVSLTLFMSFLGSNALTSRKQLAANHGSLDADPVTIRMAYWANSQLTVEKNNEVVRLFEKAYPNIRVKAEYFWGDAYSGNMAVMAATNSLPDVIRIDYSSISEYIGKDLLLPLNGFIDQNAIDLDGVHPVHNQGATVNGQTYGINIGNNALVMFYNPALLRSAGIAPPGPNYTWEQYEADLRTIKRVTGKYGAAHLTFQHFQVWLRQYGMALYNNTQTGLGYDNDELFIAFFEQQLGWQKEGLISPVALEQNTRGLDDGRFPKGMTVFGAQTYWSNQVDIMEKQLGFPVGLSMYPGPGEGMYIKPSFYHSIARTSKHPGEAAVFIDFYNNNIEVAKSLDGYFGFPYHPRIIASLSESFSPAQQKVKDYLALVEQYGSVIDPPEPALGSEVLELFNILDSEMMFGEITPEEGAKRFRDKVTALLSASSVDAPGDEGPTIDQKLDNLLRNGE
ncbi:extracellular solute-binding protein [Paenibacillaceae bacterium]|nr:extracellular solute-binding protein [Paenibacillaceae bacterium]